jgi:carbamate kinase
MSLVVVALGGNALAPRGEAWELEEQREHVRTAARAVAEVARHHDVVVTHGNGPQVGLLALQAEALGDAGALPLDVLDAESEGMIGYLIDQELGNLLPERDVATLLTQVEVDPDDRAFDAPTKPIGPVYSEARARVLEKERGYQMQREGPGFRRVVASPAPRDILELRTIGLLVKLGVIVVCAGGGGIPVVRTESGGVRGVEAVIDKDRSSALLATRLGAKALLLLTDVPAVYADWPEPARQAVRRGSPRAMRALELDRGSMGPKVEAASAFARTGGTAGIGALESAMEILRGNEGTLIVPGNEPLSTEERPLRSS